MKRWHHDSNAGSWWYGEEEDFNEGDFPGPTVILESGGYSYYYEGSDYPDGAISLTEAKDILIEEGEKNPTEEQINEAALEASQQAALEG